MNITLQVYRGLPLLGLLGVIFITLKLALVGTVAQWSWWWVLAPFWIVPALLCVGLTGLGGVMVSLLLIGKLERWWRPR